MMKGETARMVCSHMDGRMSAEGTLFPKHTYLGALERTAPRVQYSTALLAYESRRDDLSARRRTMSYAIERRGSRLGEVARSEERHIPGRMG